MKIEIYIRLHDSCGTDFGRSIAEVTDNIHEIGVVKPISVVKAIVVVKPKSIGQILLMGSRVKFTDGRHKRDTFIVETIISHQCPVNLTLKSI